jgi:hypothetical protein
MLKDKELKFSVVWDCELKQGKIILVVDDVEEISYKGKIINRYSCFGETIDEIEVEDKYGQIRKYDQRMNQIHFFDA